jgi:hypothetical protein
MAQRDFMKSVDWPKLADPVDPEKLLQLAEFAYRPTLREQLDEASPVRVGSSDPVPCHFEAR